jgi:hypothetical protein
MTIVPSVHQARQVTGVRSAIVQGRTVTLRPTLDTPEFLKLHLSSADNIQFILNKYLAGSLQLKLNDLVRAIDVECTVKGIPTITNEFYRHNYAGFLF